VTGEVDITDVTIVAVAATLCGLFMTRVRQPAIVGYILAGVILGPSGLGLVTNRPAIALLAELGVIMLLYFVGMELSLRSFRHIWKLSIVTTLAQIAAAVGLMFIVAGLLSWPTSYAVLFGCVLALSSTAVAIKLLEDIDELRTRVGRIAVGVLIAQDLAVAPMLLVIAGFAGGDFESMAVIQVAIAIIILIAVILFLTRREKFSLPFAAYYLGRPDLAPLAALTLCFGFAAGAGLIGMSPAFGAFLAGLVVGNSAQRQDVHASAGPIQTVLLMVFFLTVGLLVDLRFMWENIGLLLLLWLFVTVFKTAFNSVILNLQGESWRTAFLSSLILAQLGEFSFVLGAAAIDHTVIDSSIYRMIVAVTVLSLVTSPLWLNAARTLTDRRAKRVKTAQGLLRFVYLRELELTRRTYTRFWETAFKLATWVQIRLDRRKKLRKARGRDA